MNKLMQLLSKTKFHLYLIAVLSTSSFQAMSTNYTNENSSEILKFSEVHAELDNSSISMSFSNDYSSSPGFFVRVEVNDNYQMSCEQQRCFYSGASVNNNVKEVHRKTYIPLSFGDKVTFTMRTGGKNGKIVDRKEVIVNPHFSKVKAQLENNTISMSFSDTYSSLSDFFVRVEVNGNYQMSCEQQTCYYSWPSVKNNEKEVHRVTSEPLSFGDRVTFTMRTGGSNGEIVDIKEVIVNPYFWRC
ncbi:hypothetical protein Sps_00682 [Shewanella psychrophila]|uniref:Uncharacterized protein n=1 Tax=Shewanella psychrophila TaxID=225848 RepID=A0A1S6HK26_9GAMM|nr:hypothetical protein [Shewanella psychrophila]AQS35876.1 hypothetical protein Sps_00682 [Shewanella psychrophila]